MKLYTDYSRLTYLVGALEAIIDICKTDDACDEVKTIGKILENALKDVSENM